MNTYVTRRQALASCAIACLPFLSGCSQLGSAAPSWSASPDVDELDLAYAECFSIEEREGGYVLLTVGDADRYLVVPEGKDAPTGISEDIVVLQAPLDCIYLAATATMDFMSAIGAVGSVRLSGAEEESWYIDDARQAMANGEMQYAGKYNAPDYELLLGSGCDLAVESTMIFHCPEVKEKLEALGIPVLTDYSSYESSPLGRMEWVKFYGALTGRTEEANRVFDEVLERVTPVLDLPASGRTVAFFYITTTGTVNVRKPGDYIATVIEMAGGSYVPVGLDPGDNALATLNMDLESFTAGARDADVLIYNSTIDAELTTIDQLIDKAPVLAEFTAVRSGEVWCCGKNMYQQSMGLGDLIVDVNAVLSGAAGSELSYLYRLE